MSDALITGLAGTGVGAGVVALLVFVFRESIKAALTRSLTDQAERLKHDLQREMLKAQLSVTQVHAVYPQLLAKLHRANGAVAGQYGLRFSPSYEDHSMEDFERIVSSLNLPGNERDRIVEALKEDRRNGIKELEKVMRRVELHRGRILITKARNFTIFKSLFLSTRIKDQAFEITKALWCAWVDMDMLSMPDMDGSDRVKFFRSAQEGFKSAEAQLAAIEVAMREEMQPRTTWSVSGTG